MNWTRQLLFLAIGFVVSLVLGGVLLELSLGRWFTDDGWWRAEQLNIIRNSRIDYAVEGIYGPEMPVARYTRDAYGLRGGCADPARTDVLTIGGSTADQRYVPDGKTFQDVLQTAMTRHLGRQACVSNAGVDGHSTFGHLAAFTDWFPLIPNLRPKLILFYVGVNDAGFRSGPAAGFDLTEEGKESEIRSLLRSRSAIYRLLRTGRDLLTNVSAIKEYAGHKAGRPVAAAYVAEEKSQGVDALIIRNTEGFSRRFRALMVKTKELGAVPVCVSQPHLFVIEANGSIRGTRNIFEYQGSMYNGIDYALSIRALNEEMRKQCGEFGGYYLDLAAKSYEKADFYDAVHTTPSGSGRIGRYLFDEFVRQDVLRHLR